MTKMHFTRMKQAAHELVRLAGPVRELVRLAGAGTEIDADLLAWARQIVLQNPERAPFKPSPNQDKILVLLDDAPFDGLTAEQLAFKTGIGKKLMSATLGYMVNTTGIIVAIKLPRMSIYFRNQAALELGKPLIMAAEERRKVSAGPTYEERQQAQRDARAARRAQRDGEAEEKKRAAKELKETQRQAKRGLAEAAKEAKRAAWAARNKPKPAPKQNLTIKARPPVTIAPVRKPSIQASVFIPEHVKVQHIPSGRDTRYDPDPNSEGAGFLADWKRKRGQA